MRSRTIPPHHALLITIFVLAIVRFPINKVFFWFIGVLTPINQITEYLTLNNPQTVRDFAKGCDARFQNTQEEIVLAWRESSSVKIDQQTEYQQAISDCNRAIQLNPQLADGYNWQTNTKNALGEKKARSQIIKKHKPYYKNKVGSLKLKALQVL